MNDKKGRTDGDENLYELRLYDKPLTAQSIWSDDESKNLLPLDLQLTDEGIPDTKNMTGKIHNAMYRRIRQKGFVAPVEVLMDIGVLEQNDYENWRFGKVSFLEQVCHANLRQLSSIMREIRAYASKNDLKPSWTCYHQYGKNRKNRLRFSKSGDENFETAYATHYLDKEKPCVSPKNTDN